MSSDPNPRRSQVEAYEAVLKALSVVKLDWSNQKLLADLRRQLNVTEGDNVVSLERVLSDPEVKSSKGPSGFPNPYHTHIGRNTTTSAMRRRYPVSDTDNETDTERDEDYHRDDEDGDEDSEGSTSRPHRAGSFHSEYANRENSKGKKKSKKRPPTSGSGRRGTRPKPGPTYVESLPNRGGIPSHDRNPLSHDDVQHYEVSHGGPTSHATATSMKPPYEKTVFELCLLNGSLEELKEMSRQIKKKRQALINTMLDEEDDNSDYFDDDLVQKILLRERNARQERHLESELKSMKNKD